MENYLSFPNHRMRRLRQNSSIRSLVSESHLQASDLIYPLFITHGKQISHEISSMPGVYQYSLDRVLPEIQKITELGILGVLLFGIPQTKDEFGSSAMHPEGIIQTAVREIKKYFPQLLVMTDVCLCGYTSSGHCGIVNEKGQIENDSSCDLLASIALSHAEAGADVVAPSDMMDGRVKIIRDRLDQHNFYDTILMSYAVKYASSFYGPFREAAECAPKKGNRKTYQMNPGNRREALLEAQLDAQEGADILMVKPALAYMDIIYTLHESLLLPIAAYSVSGEYAMLKAAAEKNWISYDEVLTEMLLGFKRAGADFIITYSAKDMAILLRES